MAISYVYPNPALDGEECPICKKESWNIFKCDKCGKVFCGQCRPDLVDTSDDDTIDVTCECGSSTLFV